MSSVSEVVQSWSPSQRKEVLAEIVRQIAPTDGTPLLIEDLGFFVAKCGPARLVEFDDSTPYLQEMRRRAETMDDSETVLEFEINLDEDVNEHPIS
jgi:hypothetical protein